MAQGRVYDALFCALLLLFELFLATLPLFPTGDGPVHIYLASVFWQVATHRSPLYEHFYAVRHLVQPYSFGYYWLIGVGHFVSADGAEKLFAGFIWATLAFSFRALTRTLHPEAPAAALLVFPLLLGWPLSAGFFNFTFAVGLLLLALTFYERLGQPENARTAMAGLLVTLLLLVLAHPVPLLILICLVGLDLLQQLAARQARRPLQIAALALCCMAFVVPILIADKAAIAGSLRGFRPDLHLFWSMLFGTYVSLFFVNAFPGWLYQLLMVAVVPGAVFLAIRSGLWRRLRTGTSGASDRLLVGSLLFLAGTLVLPDTMNGSQYFVHRMWYPLWLAIAGCAGAGVTSPRWGRAVAVYATGLAVLSLGFGAIYLRPVARQQVELEQAPLPPHERGLFFQPENAGRTTGATHSWWPLGYWAGVRAFAAHDDVLLNTPWLQLTILPVKENGRAGLMRDITPEAYSESPNTMLTHLAAHPEKREEIFAKADFLLIADPSSAIADPLAVAAQLLGPLQREWRCAPHDFYAVCRR